MEFYGIRGLGRLTVKEEATLAAGLPLHSRVKTKKNIGEMRYTFDQILMASVLDQLRILNWKMSKGKKNPRNFPESILDKLLEEPKKDAEEDQVAAFDSKEAFERRRREIIGGTNAE